MNETMLLRTIFVGMLLFGLSAGAGQPGRTMEQLNRGLVAVNVGERGVYLSWRLLGTDPDGIAFDVYRDGKKVNGSPIVDSTNFLDADGAATSAYRVLTGGKGEERVDVEERSTGTFGTGILTVGWAVCPEWRWVKGCLPYSD